MKGVGPVCMKRTGMTIKTIGIVLALLICIPVTSFSTPFELGLLTPSTDDSSTTNNKISQLLSPLQRGLVVPQQQAQLSSLMDGQIQAIHKNEGELFKKGEALVTFFCPIRKARRQQAQAALNAGKKRLKVNQKLATMRAVTPLDVALLEADVLQAEAELTVQRAMLEMCQIRAPFTGRISSVQVHAHESVAQGRPLLDVATEGNFEVRVIVPSNRYSTLHIGTLFSIHLTETGRSYPVRIIRLGGRIDPVSQTLPILGQIVGEFTELMPGMGGPVTFADPPP